MIIITSIIIQMMIIIIGPPSDRGWPRRSFTLKGPIRVLSYSTPNNTYVYTNTYL